MRLISRDPFARHCTVRKNAQPGSCAWCGQQAKYVYGVQDDQHERTFWTKHKFCSVGCYRTYSGLEDAKHFTEWFL